MKILFDTKNKDDQQTETKRIKIILSEDIEFNIDVNKFGELVIRKQNFGNGEGSIVIKPSVSNEIRLL